MNTERHPPESASRVRLPKGLSLSFRMAVFVMCIILAFIAVVFNVSNQVSTFLCAILAFALVILSIGIVRRLSLPMSDLVSRKTLEKLEIELENDPGGLHVHLALLALVSILLGLSLFASASSKPLPNNDTMLGSTLAVQDTTTVILNPTPLTSTAIPTQVALQPRTPTATSTPVTLFLRKPTTTPEIITLPTTTQTPFLRSPNRIRPRVLIADVRRNASSSPSSLEEEYILLLNFGEELEMKDWTVTLDSGEIFRFNNFKLAAGSFAKIYTVSEQFRPPDLFWKIGSPLWSRKNYVIVLSDNLGLSVDRYERNMALAGETPTVLAMP